MDSNHIEAYVANLEFEEQEIIPLLPETKLSVVIPKEKGVDIETMVDMIARGKALTRSQELK